MAKIIGNTTATPLIPPDVSGIEATFKRTKYYGDADIIPTDSSLFSYALNNDGQSYTIKSGDVKLGGRIVIPYEYNGLPITRISGFREPSLQEIILPNCIQSIMSSAFYSCGSLAKVVIPDSVIYIGDYAFEECVSLRSITIPNSVTTIGEGAFYNCSNLKHVYVSNGIETIGSDAFSGCGDLNVYLADGQLWGFPTRYKDAKITLHDDWNPLMKGEASETYATKVYVNDISTNSIIYYGEAGVIPTDSSLFKYSLNDNGQSYTIRSKDTSLSGKIVIPYTYKDLPITAIDDFDGTGITEVILPNCIREIKTSAFAACSSLSKAIIPIGVTSIGDDAFYECVKLTSVNIPNGVTSIGGYAFGDCTKLTSVSIPNSVTSIGGYAFDGCRLLKDVYYEGAKEQWNAIEINKTGNEALLNANIHYDWNPAMKGELSETYATKKEIGDRSQLIDAPNNDLVTAINRAWNNAETARNMVNTLDTDVSTLREEVGNIGTALDGIIAIQNTLIGGGSV